MVLSHISAVLLALLAVGVMLKERKASGVWLSCALMVQALILEFDQVAISHAERLLEAKRVVIVLKSLLPPMFLGYGLSFRRRETTGLSVLPFTLMAVLGGAFTMAAAVLPMDFFFTVAEVVGEPFLVLGRIGYWFYLGLMIFCVAALAVLEAVFASFRGADRWRVKYEHLGVATVLGSHIIVYSQGLLYRGVSLSLLPMQAGVLIVAVLLIGYSRLFRGRAQKVAVSRTVVYRSFTLLFVGAYLFVLGIVGQILKHYEIPWSRGVAWFLALVSGVLFLAVLFSEDIRRRVKISMVKHFYAHKHDYREQWVGLSNALAVCRGQEDVYEVILDTYRSSFGLRYVALYRCSAGDSLELAVAQGREGMPAVLPLSRDLRRYFTEMERVWNPVDGEYTPTEGEATATRGMGLWLVVPLTVGQNLVAVAALGPQIVAEKLTYEDFDLMKIIGRQAALSLNDFRLTEELSAAREMAAVAKVSSFVIHDLKNLAYTFSLMMENAQEHIAEPEFQGDLVKSIHNTVAKMNALIAKLKAFPDKRELNLEPADLAPIVRETLDEIGGSKPRVIFTVELAAAETRLDVQEIRKVALNLLLNACDAIGDSGRVEVRTGRSGGEVFLSVEDDGCGMSASFVQGHLFKPFRTTKEKGLGIGLYQCKQIVEAHGGRIEVASREREGTVFTVFLPPRENPVPADRGVTAARPASAASLVSA